MKKLIESESINENDIIRWNNIYDSGFKYFFENLRDVTRYINVLKFYFEIVKGKVNPIDFFAITAIQVFSPDVYQRIRENKSVFAGSFTQFHDMYREDYKETLSSIIESSNDSTKKFLKEYLTYLFPKIFHFTGNSSDGFLTVNLSRRDRLICNEDFFDLYFSFSLPKGEISNEEIESILNSVDSPETLSAKLEELSSKKFLGFLSIIPGYLDNIQEDDVKFMVTVLMDLGDHFPKDELYSYNNYKVIHDCINLLLSKLEDEGEKFVILENSFKNATRSLCTIVNEMHYLRNEHDKYYGKEIYKYSTIILNVDQLKTLEDVVSKKLKDKAENRDLDIHPNIAYILKRWKSLGAKEEEIDNVISRIIQNEDKLINFISSCMFVPRNNCIFENKIEFDISLVEEFMNLEEVESSMKKFDFSGDLWGMNEREKLIVKHFLVNVENAKKSNEKPLIGTIKQEHF